MVTLIKNVSFVLMLSVFTLISGCSIIGTSEQTNEPALSSEHSITLVAQKFGQHLAKHILNHPDIANNIHCAIIPSNSAHSADGSTVANSSDDMVNEKQLCTLEVVEYSPELITQMSFFVKEENGDITVIDSFHVEGEATLGRIVFSQSGKYFYLVKTDEGHPWFTFYDTQKFLSNYMYAQVGEVFEEYS